MFNLNKLVFVLLTGILMISCTADVGIDQRSTAAPDSSNQNQSHQIIINAQTPNLNHFAVGGNCPDIATTVNLGAPLNVTTLCASGNFLAIVDVSQIAEGQYNFNVNFEGSSQIEEWNLLVDLTPPKLTLVSPAKGSMAFVDDSNVLDFVVNGKCSKEDGDVRIKIDEIKTTTHCENDTFAFSINLTYLSNGVYTAYVIQTDYANNSTMASITVSKSASGATKLLMGRNDGVSNEAKWVSNDGNYILTGVLGQPLQGNRITGNNGYQLINITPGGR